MTAQKNRPPTSMMMCRTEVWFWNRKIRRILPKALKYDSIPAFFDFDTKDFLLLTKLRCTLK